MSVTVIVDTLVPGQDPAGPAARALPPAQVHRARRADRDTHQPGLDETLPEAPRPRRFHLAGIDVKRS